MFVFRKQLSFSEYSPLQVVKLGYEVYADIILTFCLSRSIQMVYIFFQMTDKFFICFFGQLSIDYLIFKSLIFKTVVFGQNFLISLSL